MQHLGHPGDLRRRLRGVGALVPGHEHVDLAADLLRRGDRVERRLADGLVVVLGEDEDAHRRLPVAAPLLRGA